MNETSWGEALKKEETEEERKKNKGKKMTQAKEFSNRS